MNIDNINKTIAIMERARERDSVYMPHWQSNNTHVLEREEIAKNEEEFHACGNQACLAGHIAISPEWQADGGIIAYGGVPIMKNIHHFPSDSLGEWWGVNANIAESLILSGRRTKHIIYGVPWEDVKAEHVLKALHELRDLGTAEFAKKYKIEVELQLCLKGLA